MTLSAVFSLSNEHRMLVSPVLFRNLLVLRFKRYGACVSGKNTVQKAVTLPPRMTITHMVHRQLTLLVIKPPMIGAKGGDPNMEPTATVRLSPRPTACQLSVDAPETMVNGPAPKQPARKRPMRMVGTFWPNAGIRVNIAAPPLPVSIGILRPNFSDSGPQKGGPRPKPCSKISQWKRKKEKIELGRKHQHIETCAKQCDLFRKTLEFLHHLLRRRLEHGAVQGDAGCH